MNCREAEKMLDGYFDGELDGDSMREAAVHVAHCGSCEAEIGARERVQGLLRESVADAVEGIDVDLVWRGVEASIDDGPTVARRPGSFWRRAKPRGGPSTGDAASGTPEAAALDPTGEWLRKGAPGRARSWIAAAALAAGLAGFVAVRGLPGSEPATRIATGSGPPGAEIAPGEAVPPPVARLAQAPLPVPGAPSTSGRRGRITVDSVDFEGNSLAMWSEPETDTTVIWIDEDEPSTAGAGLR